MLGAQLDGFVVGIHSVDPVIRITRLTSPEEINRHQDFFEHYTKEYRKLATELIFVLTGQLSVEIMENNPLVTFAPFKCNRKRKGKMGKWQYCFHGFHYTFESKKTEQNVEIPFACGFAFGDLDPYFFSGFTGSTPAQQPLPVAIRDDYHDGNGVIRQLPAPGKLRKIPPSTPQYIRVVAVNRSSVDIASFRLMLESRPHRCKLRQLLKRVKNSQRSRRWNLTILLVLASTILSLTGNLILSNWGKRWRGWNKTLLNRTLEMIWEMIFMSGHLVMLSFTSKAINYI